MALFDLMIDGTGELGVRSPRCGLCTFSCLFPPFASSASYDAPPFIFSEEPYTIRGSTTTFFTPFFGREYIVFTVPLMDLGSRDIESSTSASMESTGRTHGSVIPPYFFYQIYLRLTSHALVPLLPSSWFPLWFSLFRALLSSRADHKRHSK